MKRKALCFALALLMCMMIAVPAFADSSVDTSPEKAGITATFGLKHISGSTYKMWAKILNPAAETVSANLVLYDASYNVISTVSGTSSSTVFNLSKNVSLSSGTYHLRLTVQGNTVNKTFEKTYTI